MNTRDRFVHTSDIDWIESMFYKFMQHDSIDPSWTAFFEGYQLGLEAAEDQDGEPHHQETLQEKKSQLLLMVYRLFGYLQGEVSPLESAQESKLIQEKLKSLHLDDQIPSLGLLPQSHVSVREFIAFLKDRYCGSLVVETLTCSPDVQEFIWKLIEEKKDPLPSEHLLQAYADLARATFFEEYLQVKFTGKKRFSLEGGESLIPMLNYLVTCGFYRNIRHYVVGMAHRGRLNVLTNILDKPYHQIFMEFEDQPLSYGVDQVGDVKYHKGYTTTKQIQEQNVQIDLLPNPSHLEATNPIVEGWVAALQHQGAPDHEMDTLAVLLHGDAAFAGQGIVYETLQLSKVPGYSTFGSLHIVINNHIGFTSLPRESRSTPYCTDVSKMLGIPVFRVNAEDVPACLRAIEYAVAVRSRFQCDVIIDLCCYRKHGHNESDDPSVTSPRLYHHIQQKPTILSLFGEELLADQGNNLSAENLSCVDTQVKESLQGEFALLQQKQCSLAKNACIACEHLETPQQNIDVSLHREDVVAMITKLCHFPEHFAPHSKIQALIKKRIRMGEGELGIDWGLAEELAFASLLVEGYSLRLSGQDVIRGTFSQRNLLWSDVNTGDTFSPLYSLSSEQGSVELYNSPLSEYGVLGFEYGYACKAKNTLVIWEAQFGDFSNGAQIIFDQYISSAIQKWDLHSHVVLLLPHGYEGQGPEHSSARIERYLQLAAGNNFRVVQPSTPVQYFRILREHARQHLSQPLVIFTPKALLRHPSCVSSLEMFSVRGGFETILEDEVPNREAQILVLCSGKVYYDYLSHLPSEDRLKFACLRIESLYPLPVESLMQKISEYPSVHTYVWLQEEPANMGAFEYFFMATQNIFPKKLHCVSRQRSSSTATGSETLSRQELSTLMHTLFSLAR